MKKKLKIISLVGLALVMVLSIGFLVYVSDYEKATEPALEALISNELVDVELLDKTIVYTPKDKIDAGLIFYPGGKVEPTVYSRTFMDLAENGIQTIVVKMPFNLAMFNIKGAEDVLAQYPEIDTWYMGGHSLGGVFATEYLKDHSDAFEGIVYMASYPNSDISETDLKVLSLKGTLDTVLNKEGLESAKDLLPDQTVYWDIVGGNHTQFGDYNLQNGDTAATISADEQRAIVVTKILEWIKE